MNCKIPYTKDIDFETKLEEITSISLEHDYHVEDGTLKGNFIVSGDFKSHEVSVNKEAFSYILPFEIDLNNNIDENTLEFMIDDFTYEVREKRYLRVNIDFHVIASLKEEDKEETIFSNIDEAFLGDDKELREDKEEIKEEVREEVKEALVEEIKPSEVKDEETKKVEDTIINNVSPQEDEYATYHIHMVGDQESVETICTMYNSNMSILSEYNDLNNLTSGDKLIIPENNE